MSLLKNIWKGSSKPKKLCEEWNLAANQDFDDDFFSPSGNSSYKVKYLGHIPVDSSNNTQHITEKAIDSIISMSKANRKSIKKVMVSVNLKGIEVTDRSNEKPLFDVSIFRICSCLAYAKCRRVFAFLATDVQETTECHAFMCSKRSTAESMAVTVAQLFSAVYHMWQSAQREGLGTLYYNNGPLLQPSLPSYSKHEVDFKITENVPLTTLSSTKWISFDGSLKDGSLPSTRSLAYAEVYVSPPAYSEKPFSGNQTLDSKEWSECSKSVELIVL
uniref:PID domain-containing protein n=1 Tax=Graphocephala atropunctata TaxID=36148 RepID=A0A1B6L2I4_9HEMI